EGYAHNYLFKRNLAEPMTRGGKKAVETEKQDQAAKNARLLKQAEEQAEELNRKQIRISAKSGENGKLFGSITSKDIAKAIKKASGIEISKRDILLDEHIKKLGKFEITIKFHPKLKAPVEIEIVEEE
ncbi:MAG: 50S ribosomal protein L9, partial [Vulcanimicrobiota bacterium]